MRVYGFTRICTKNSGGDLTQSTTKLFLSQYERDMVMYNHYTSAFNSMGEKEGFEGKKNRYVDTQGSEQKGLKEFMESLGGHRKSNTGIHGRIAAFDYCTWFEPFFQDL